MRASLTCGTPLSKNKRGGGCEALSSISNCLRAQIMHCRTTENTTQIQGQTPVLGAAAAADCCGLLLRDSTVRCCGLLLWICCGVLLLLSSRSAAEHHLFSMTFE